MQALAAISMAVVPAEEICKDVEDMSGRRTKIDGHRLVLVLRRSVQSYYTVASLVQR